MNSHPIPGTSRPKFVSGDGYETAYGTASGIIELERSGNYEHLQKITKALTVY